ncbi:SfnB family sulfur acquisition oxidoreductase [Nocardioides sp. KR10-350]|uniref:SfnB family sulfur acquisition oxidoreductase n=1 Tax=Nocardioides cheoyonin TaxID=3156615 RepID=UPI0032B47DC2
MTATQSDVRVPVLTADEAVATARELGERFAEGAAERDRSRTLPYDEVKALAASGLLAITVPAAYGGPQLPVSAVAEVFRLLAWGDPNIAQIPHSHFVYVNQLKLRGTPQQQALILGEVLAGKTVANAQSEFGTKHVRDFRTTLTEAGDGRWLLSGEKFYCTGSLFADYLAVLGHRRRAGGDENGADGPLAVAWVPSDAPGVERIDDWDAVGQRTTGSGTVRLDEVVVTDEWITEFSPTFEGPTTYGAFAQVLHAALDAGIARRALEEAAAFVRERSRPYPDARATYGVERAAEDPLVVQALGEMELAVRGAEALVAEAARAIDAADADLTDESAGAASLAVAAARAATTAASVDVASRLFEVAGTRSALAGLDLDRHWRNARTHTLHDPAAWKVQHLGRWAVDGTLPPRHGQL